MIYLTEIPKSFISITQPCFFESIFFEIEHLLEIRYN